MKFLRNSWYQIAWAEELSDNEMLRRTVLGEDIVLFRSEGVASALRDRCPHRFAPLSLGKLEAGNVTCPYHGLRFSSTGDCVHNPHGVAVSALAVRRYPVIERHDALWIWMGDAAAAEPAAIPDLSFIDACPETAKIRSYTAVDAHYELLTDNIVDLSHADYLHPTSLGSGFNTRTKAQITEADDRIIVAWEADSEEAPPAFQIASPAKLWTIVHWFAPAVMVLRAGGHPVNDPAAMIDSLNLHSMTPATETSSHYFACNTRSFRVEDAAFNAVLKSQLLHAFQVEDKPMVEAVQRNMGTIDLWAFHPAMFPSDRGAACVRRRLAKMIAAETRPWTGSIQGLCARFELSIGCPSGPGRRSWSCRLQRFPGGRMNVHKNARLTAHSRAELVRSVSQPRRGKPTCCGLTRSRRLRRRFSEL